MSFVENVKNFFTESNCDPFILGAFKDLINTNGSNKKIINSLSHRIENVKPELSCCIAFSLRKTIDKNFDIIKVVNEKHFVNADLDRFIEYHMLVYLDILTKKFFRNTKFIKYIYDNYIKYYLECNKNLVKDNVVNHMYLDVLIDPIYTGMIDYITSEECVDLFYEKLYYDVKKYIINDGETFLNDIESFTSPISYNEYMRFNEFVYKYVFGELLKQVVKYFMINYKEFDLLNFYINDCKMGFTRRLGSHNLNYECFKSLINRLDKFKENYKNGKMYSFIEIIENKKVYVKLMKDYCDDSSHTDSKFMTDNMSGDFDPNAEMSETVFDDIFFKSGFYNFVNAKCEQEKNVCNNLINYSILKHYFDVLETSPSYIGFKSVSKHTLDDLMVIDEDDEADF